MTPRRLGGPRSAGPAIALLCALVFAPGGLVACSPTDAEPATSPDGAPASEQTPALSEAPPGAAPGDTEPPSGDDPAAPPAGDPSNPPIGSDAVHPPPFGGAAQPGPRDGPPRSGDMLTAEELRSAEDLALDAASGMLAAATDRDALSATADLAALADQPTYRVMYAQRYQTKNEEPRSAEVAFYRYDTNEVVLSKVNLEDESVTQLPVPPGYLAPLLPEEIQEAARVARADANVADYLETVGLDPASSVANGLLTTSTSDESSTACAATRCVRLFFFDAEHVVPTFTVVVDLGTVTVVEIVPMFPPTVEEVATP